MHAIDFMNKSIYLKEPGTIDNMKGHPKFALIRPDGIILYADMSNDGKIISIGDKEMICDQHQHYLAKLVENFYPEKTELLEKITQGNVYAPIYEFLEEGNIVFNNITTYEGPTFFLNGVHGQLLIPINPTDIQKESLKTLDPYVNYFREIEVKEYQDFEKNIKETYFENGSEAIKNFLARQQEYGQSRH